MIAPIIPAVLAAGAIATFALGLWLPAYLRHRTLRQRLAGFVYAGTTAGFALDAAGRRRRAVTRRVRARKQPFARLLSNRIALSHADVSPGEVVVATIILGVVAFVIASGVAGSIGVGALAGLAAGGAPMAWLEVMHRRALGRFSSQLLDTILLLASSVRGGHSLLQALEQVASQAPEPTKTAFALAVREIGLGASQESALDRLAERFPSEDFVLIVSAINAHQQVGGSLARMLDAIGQTVRERQHIAGDIKSFTSQQRYSAYVLSALPVAAMAALAAFSPDYVSVMFEYDGLRLALAIAAAMVVAGFLLMRHLASINV
ncbi:MAG TPA: type II secretion system F family protein [Candidatus Limnocylindria bacterium]|nr:type II secretion system F family protein [Candidatus Limnocylindria bacterium]